MNKKKRVRSGSFTLTASSSGSVEVARKNAVDRSLDVATSEC